MTLLLTLVVLFVGLETEYLAQCLLYNCTHMHPGPPGNIRQYLRYLAVSGAALAGSTSLSSALAAKLATGFAFGVLGQYLKPAWYREPWVWGASAQEIFRSCVIGVMCGDFFRWVWQ